MDVSPPPGYRSGFVAIVGRANVGKSTLLNALVGEKVAIVAPRPQTTRRRLLGIRTSDDAQAIFVDTPGVHRPRTALGRYMVSVARHAIPEADLAVWVVDVSRLPTHDDLTIGQWLEGSRAPTLVAMNKSDRLRPQDIARHTEAYRELAAGAEWLLTIATAGHNVDKLWSLIASRLPPGPPLYPADQITDQTERLLVAELVRESALCLLADEVPYGVDVVVVDWAERSNGMLYVAAKLLVERESHKGIVIGAGGAMLKRIGARARREVERLLERRVYLDLAVTVRARWRESPEELRHLGYV